MVVMSCYCRVIAILVCLAIGRCNYRWVSESGWGEDCCVLLYELGFPRGKLFSLSVTRRGISGYRSVPGTGWLTIASPSTGTGHAGPKRLAVDRCDISGYPRMPAGGAGTVPLMGSPRGGHAGGTGCL